MDGNAGRDGEVALREAIARARSGSAAGRDEKNKRAQHTGTQDTGRSGSNARYCGEEIVNARAAIGLKTRFRIKHSGMIWPSYDDVEATSLADAIKKCAKAHGIHESRLWNHAEISLPDFHIQVR